MLKIVLGLKKLLLQIHSIWIIFIKITLLVTLLVLYLVWNKKYFFKLNTDISGLCFNEKNNNVKYDILYVVLCNLYKSNIHMEIKTDAITTIYSHIGVLQLNWITIQAFYTISKQWNSFFFVTYYNLDILKITKLI